MSAEIIEDPKSFVAALGGLHDTDIVLVEFDIENCLLALAVADLNANFVDLPADPGRRPCKLLFEGVTNLSLDIETAEGVWISHAEVSGATPKFRLEADLSLGGGEKTSGRKSIVVTFDQLRISDV